MPRFDGTGPRGEGSMTGRGMGYCAVPLNDNAGAWPGVPRKAPGMPVRPYLSNFPGRGARAGMGRGWGRGMGRGRGGRRGGGRRW